MDYVRIYIDHARELVDIDYSDCDLPCGSNWSVCDRVTAEARLAELLFAGYARGYETPVYA